MSEIRIVNASRRDFLRSGAAGLTLAVLAPRSLAQSGPGKTVAAAPAGAALAPNAFVRIGTDGSVTVIVKHLEMGQGTYTGLPTVVADELDADWAHVRVEAAPADASRYNNLFWGPAQGTGGSTAMANSWEQLRVAGATARAMLVAAAAAHWKVPEAEIGILRGMLSHPSGKRGRFGEFVTDAARLPVPQKVTLKDPKQFAYIGKRAPRLDARAKVDGSARFTQDVKLPGMLTAVVAHPPRFGARLRRFDAEKARAVGGVVDVVAFNTGVTNGVAVLARDFWSAKKGRDALVLEWDETNAYRGGSAELLAEYRKLAATPGAPARRDGDAEAAFGTAARTLEASYEFPFLAHAAMEPMNCVVRLDTNGVEIWNGAQLQTGDQYAVAQLLALKPEQVKINMLYAGGSFGRRANPLSDYVLEAAAIAKASGGNSPVKLVWTREDDTRAGFYRPLYVHSLKAGLDRAGNIVAWQHRIVGQSILAGTAFEQMLVKNGVDATSVEGAATLPYTIPNLSVELHSPKIGIPVQWWRSVGSTHTAFATECFLDELARAAGKEPFQLRRALLAKHPRHKAVLELAASKAEWSKSAGKGRARGIAVHESFQSYVAQVVELAQRKDGLHIERIVCAIDCGIAVNPDVVRMQMESGIGYGLSAALSGAITLKDGLVEQSNFHDYDVLRIDQLPEIEVHIVRSRENPTGVGEPATPVIAPALANAILALTGKPVRALPLSGQGIALV